MKISLRSVPFLARHGQAFNMPWDDMESYTDTALLSGLNGGIGDWAGAYVGRPAFYSVWNWDDMESYANTDPLNGLNGGSGWSTAYVGRSNT